MEDDRVKTRQIQPAWQMALHGKDEIVVFRIFLEREDVIRNRACRPGVVIA
jgi:hypothetical protein